MKISQSCFGEVLYKQASLRCSIDWSLLIPLLFMEVVKNITGVWKVIDCISSAK